MIATMHSSIYNDPPPTSNSIELIKSSSIQLSPPSEHVHISMSRPIRMRLVSPSVRIKGMNLCRFISFGVENVFVQALSGASIGTDTKSCSHLLHIILFPCTPFPRRARRQSFLLVAMSVCWFASKEKRRGGKLLELQRHHTHRWLQTIQSFYWFLHFPIFPYSSQCVATIFEWRPHITCECVLACIRDWCVQSELL